jgi:TM2 domain-containing membrane protein YozV
MLALWFIPMIFMNVAPESLKFQVSQFINNVNFVQLAFIGIGVILLLSIGVIWLAIQKFQRTRLILD